MFNRSGISKIFSLYVIGSSLILTGCPNKNHEREMKAQRAQTLDTVDTALYDVEALRDKVTDGGKRKVEIERNLFRELQGTNFMIIDMILYSTFEGGRLSLESLKKDLSYHHRDDNN